MKKTGILLMGMLAILLMSFHTVDEEELRSLYWQAANSREAADQLMKALSAVDDQSEPLLVCYKGAAEMLQAKYVLNPFSKLSRFQKGKALIESAIKRDPEHFEMRFLRFSIQCNLPSFLGYNDWIETDKRMLIDRLGGLGDTAFKQDVIKYLSGSKYCTKEELKIIGK
ncbi:hypothetical protein PBAL39_25500 [Pedobacter sp. BAL39]|uniref:hypothetical protein n=1 Tax=Pedobacter sp. BAL39 TaxID=391596 RepID=UPI000155951A|nr:hypothetical protein [Pedobacter sp. BAL39]EDM36686.1 hypothetical protein PBAL39_25500 [Pedobacter sp. BAL39]